MTSSYILKQYIQSNFYSVSSLCRLFNLSQKELSGWIKNNIYPDFKTRFNCLRKLDTSELKEEITIKDKDGFEFNLIPKMSKKFQTAKGRQHYYQSDTFEELKNKVSKRSGNKCELCGVPGSGSDGRKGITCHHLVYDQDFGTGNENLDDLIDVCFYHHAMLQEMLKDYSEYGISCFQPLYTIIRDLEKLSSEELKYILNPFTHLDFVVFNKLSKQPIVAVEVDGYGYHKEGTEQHERDKKKNKILELCGLPLVRICTNGSGERERILRAMGICQKEYE